MFNIFFNLMFYQLKGDYRLHIMHARMYVCLWARVWIPAQGGLSTTHYACAYVCMFVGARVDALV